MPIRWRIAAASTLAAIVVLAGAGLIFLTTLRSGLNNSLDISLRTRADQLAAQLTSGSDPRSGSVRLSDNTYGQVLTTSGRVVVSTQLDLTTPLLSTAQARSVGSSERAFNVRLAEHERDNLPQDQRVLARPIGSSGRILVVSVSRNVVDEAIERAGKQLLVVGAVVLVIGAGGSWLLAGSALRPVERLRRQAAAIGADDAAGGLAVPRSRDEIHRLAVTMNGLLARLHGAIQREREFVADAGHELRTPLAVLSGEIELARRPGRSRAEIDETLAVAAEETARLVSLTEGLLTLARDETGQPGRAQRLDVTAVAGESVERALAANRESAIDVHLVSPAAVIASGDPVRIGRALDNVVANAMRHAASVVDVTVITTPDTVRIIVHDDGSGFPSDFLPHAFERFRRADTARTRAESGTEGSGLGLAIVRAILRSHGGDATAANAADGGASVELWWPTREGERPGRLDAR